MEWRSIDQCPEYTKGVFGYMDQFDAWYYTTFPSRDLPISLGYTHWLEIIPPVAETVPLVVDSELDKPST